MIWVRASQTIVEIPKPSALMPSLLQGETALKPRPKPSRMRMSDNAAAAMAPANIAAQETPEVLADSSRAVAARSGVVIIFLSLLGRKQPTAGRHIAGSYGLVR